MTQAINLANFANCLDASGGVPPTQLNAVVPISKGGTNASTAAQARTNLDVAQAVYSVPSGGIIMWSGSIASIPAGWLLCDGTLGTPDLRSKFVIGAGPTYAVGNSGGASTVTLTQTELPSHTHSASFTGSALPTHTHTINYGTGLFGGGGSQGVELMPRPSQVTTNAVSAGTPSGTVTVNSTGSGAAFSVLNPYYALAFIMKS